METSGNKCICNQDIIVFVPCFLNVFLSLFFGLFKGRHQCTYSRIFNLLFLHERSCSISEILLTSFPSARPNSTDYWLETKKNFFFFSSSRSLFLLFLLSLLSCPDDAIKSKAALALPTLYSAFLRPWICTELTFNVCFSPVVSRRGTWMWMWRKEGEEEKRATTRKRVGQKKKKKRKWK